MSSTLAAIRSLLRALLERSVLGAVSALLEPFCRHLSPKVNQAGTLLATQGPSNLNQTTIFEDFVKFWRKRPTKWLQVHTNGSKNGFPLSLPLFLTLSGAGCAVTYRATRKTASSPRSSSCVPTPETHRDLGSEHRVRGLFKVKRSELRVQGSGFGVQGSGFRAQGSGFRA